jgi:porphobilinogen synthase
LNLLKRPRRNRKNSLSRHWRQDTHLSRQDFVYPLFLVDGNKQKQEIESMPGQFRWSVDEVLNVCEQTLKKGVEAVALFPAVEDSLKNSQALEALNPNNLNARAIKEIKKRFPELVVITDIALDPYSSDGHDGLVKDGVILNDETLQILSEMAVLHVESGADIVAPSDMMDGRVLAIREALDDKGFSDRQIISYTAKYASAFYGPFREALDSSPKAGDKKTYQMSPGSKKEALLECQMDEEEGADILMVKPALPYLDIITDLKNHTLLPVAAYNVSGEYAMIMAASQKGWLDQQKAIGEALLSIKRAGADVIFTYFALHDYTL